MADINKPFPLPEPILKDKPPARLPYPDMVPEVPMRQSKGPGIFDRLWRNKWNLARHFIIQGSIAAGATWEATRSLNAAAIAFVSGGTVGAGRKAIDDIRRSDGKADMITAIFKPKPRGDSMSTRTDVEEVGTAIYDLVMAVFCKDEDKAAKILTATLATIKEGADLMDIPKDDIPEAAAHALSMATAKAIAAKVVYTDEKPPTV